MAGFLARYDGGHNSDFQGSTDRALEGAFEGDLDGVVSFTSVEVTNHNLPAVDDASAPAAKEYPSQPRFFSESEDRPDASWWLRWSAVVVGVLANLLSSTYYTIMSYLEGEGMWTIRLSLVTIERYIFASGAIAIVTALVLDFAALSQGQDVDATVLFLSVEVGVFLSTVMIPAMLTHKLRVLVYKAWTGPSRTACDYTQSRKSLSDEHWQRVVVTTERMGPQYSTEFNLQPARWILGRRRKTWADVSAIVAEVIAAECSPVCFDSRGSIVEGLRFKYYPNVPGVEKVSILWGGQRCTLFQPRVSRAIFALDEHVIHDSFSRGSIFKDRYTTIAKGVLGRNKGLQPWRMLFRTSFEKVGENEELSPHRPRPSKTGVLKQRQAMQKDFGGLGVSYVNAATELALLCEDIAPQTLCAWLDAEHEHQDLDWSWKMNHHNPALVDTMYKLQYAVMLLSLNCGTSPKIVNVALRPEATVLVIWLCSQHGGIQSIQGGEDSIRSRLLEENHYHTSSSVRIGLYYLGLDSAMLAPRVIGTINIVKHGGRLCEDEEYFPSET